jgi:hypothetical protein
MIEVVQIAEYMAGESAPPQRVLARIAARQHGVCSRAQIDALGLDDQFAGRALACGRLHHVHRGVYAVGHPPLTERARWMAAVLAGGEGAVLSHVTAAVLWAILEWASDVAHIVIEGSTGHRRPGLVMHRTRSLPAEQRCEIDGIPVTSVERTLLDCAVMLSHKRLRFAVEAADRAGLLDVLRLVALCDASRGRRGIGRLRRLALEQRGAVARTKSPPEATFLSLCLSHGLPEPLVNSVLHGYEVDFHWPRARLVVEIDTYTYHRSWPQRQRDLERDVDLKVHGEEVLRFTRERVESAGDAVAAQVASLLEMRSV